MNYQRLLPCLFITTLALTSTKALADDRAIGTISDFIVNNSSSDNASYQLGSITVGNGTASNIIHWGGNACKNIALPTTTQMELLATAAATKKKVTLFHKNGCLTGVWVNF